MFYRGKQDINALIQTLKTIRITTAEEALRVYPALFSLMEQLRDVQRKSAYGGVLADSHRAVKKRIQSGKMNPVGINGFDPTITSPVMEEPREPRATFTISPDIADTSDFMGDELSDTQLAMTKEKLIQATKKSTKKATDKSTKKSTKKNTKK